MAKIVLHLVTVLSKKNMAYLCHYKFCDFCSKTFQAFHKPNFYTICWLKFAFAVTWIYALLSTCKKLVSKSFTCVAITKWKFSYFSVPVWFSLTFIFTGIVSQIWEAVVTPFRGFWYFLLSFRSFWNDNTQTEYKCWFVT